MGFFCAVEFILLFKLVGNTASKVLLENKQPPLDTERGCFVARTLTPGAQRLGCLRCFIYSLVWFRSASVSQRTCWTLQMFIVLGCWGEVPESSGTPHSVCRASLNWLNGQTFWRLGHFEVQVENKQTCLCSMEQEMASYHSRPFLTPLINEENDVLQQTYC